MIIFVGGIMKSKQKILYNDNYSDNNHHPYTDTDSCNDHFFLKYEFIGMCMYMPTHVKDNRMAIPGRVIRQNLHCSN